MLLTPVDGPKRTPSCLVNVTDRHAHGAPRANLGGALAPVASPATHPARDGAGVERLQTRLDVLGRHRRIGDEVKHLAHGGHRHAVLGEKLTQVKQILAQEIQTPGVIQVHRLAHVDDVRVSLFVASRDELERQKYFKTTFKELKKDFF